MKDLPEIPTQPFMPTPCISYIGDQLQRCKSYLEYGSGGSTMLALSLQVPLIHSIESDQAWLNRVKEMATSMYPTYKGQHLCTWVNIGNTGDWGYPITGEAHASYWQYPSSPWIGCMPEQKPDLVLIDGRFRVACLLLTMAYADPGTTILFDDYLDRPHYHCVESLWKPAETIDRMAVFRKSDALIDRKTLLELLLPTLQDTR